MPDPEPEERSGPQRPPRGRSARKPTDADDRGGGEGGAGGNAGRLPQLHIGGPTRAGWREDVLARAAEVETLAHLLQAEAHEDDARAAEVLVQAIRTHAKAATGAATARAGLLTAAKGVHVARATRNIHAAEMDLLRLAPTEYLRGQLPVVQAYVHAVLPRDDIGRKRLDIIVKQPALSAADRETVLATLHAAQDGDRKSVARVRSFRNVLHVTAAMLVVGVTAVALLGAFAPDALPICFQPVTDAGTNIVCPTEEAPLPPGADVDTVTDRTANGWDLALIELVGVLAAGIAAAAAIRRIKGTSTPYSIPLALAVLKLPTGALTALLGLLLMRGQFVPGLSALDSSGQIIAWAVVFGYSQELFTRLVDNQAQSVLDKAGTPARGPGADDSAATPAEGQ